MRRCRKLLGVLHQRAWLIALIRHRVVASIEHQKLLEEGAVDVVIDVGANRGQFSLLAARLWPYAAIQAFEPLEGPADLCAKVMIAHPNFTLHRSAAGVEQGQERMSVSKQDDSSSLLIIGELQSRVFPGTEASGFASVNVERLDAVLLKKDLSGSVLLKVDVQGFELQVLAGAVGIIEHVDLVLIELSFAALYEGQALAGEVLDWLHDNGFSISAMGAPTLHDGTILQVDVLLRRRE